LRTPVKGKAVHVRNIADTSRIDVSVKYHSYKERHPLGSETVLLPRQSGSQWTTRTITGHLHQIALRAMWTAVLFVRAACCLQTTHRDN